MNAKEQLFVKSIQEKIKNYSIKTTLKEAILKASKKFVDVQYNDGEIETVDTNIEWYLCSLSPYYFIDRYAWINFPGVGVIPFKLYYFQKEILKEINNYRRAVFLKSRQCGISTLFSLYCLWRCLFRESEYIDVVSLKQKKARDFVSKMDPTLQRLPLFLSVKIIVKNQNEIKWANSSQIVSEAASERSGRSDSLSLLILDEAAHYISDRLTRGIVGAANPTLSRTGGQMVMISTPNGISGSGSWFYEQVQQLQINGNSDERKLIEIDWYEVPDLPKIKPHKGYNSVLDRYIKKDYYNKPEVRQEIKKLFEPVGLNWKANEWLKEQHADLQDILYKQEILHNFIVSGNQVFEEEILKKLENSIKEPIEKNKLGTAAFKGFWVWKKPIPGHRYIIGCDVSTGTGSDYSSLEVFDVGEYEQAAEYKGFISTPAFSRAIKRVARYYNEAYVVIECNGIGEAIFNGIYYDEEDPYNNLFKQKKTKNNITRMTGWITDTKTRKLITNELIDWLSVEELWSQIKVYSKRIWEEAITWIWEVNKPIHASTAHDDSLIALALAIYHRDKAMNTGESFLINEKGDLVEFDSSDKIDKDEIEENFDIIRTGEQEDDGDFFKKKYNVSEEQYKWLIG